jgi:hypothetical protein
MSIDKNNHLNRVLESHRMSHVGDLMEKYKTKREKVKDALEDKFKEEIVSRAINSGSYAKHDAVNIKFDLDVCQPFKRNSFDTLKKMADAVFDFFNNEFEDDDLLRYETRKQRVSTGITFNVDGDEIQMDIVPGRELLKDDYSETNRINLYVRPKLFEDESSTQTNIQKHIDLIKGKDAERKVIRLLKIWKVNRRKKKVKSFLVELITIRAFDNSSNIPSDQWGKLKMVMEYIRDNIETIRLEDPANSNNVVSDTMSESDKIDFSYDMKEILDDIEKDDNRIKKHFTINDEFDKNDDEDKKAAALEVVRSGIVKKPWSNLNC